MAGQPTLLWRDPFRFRPRCSPARASFRTIHVTGIVVSGVGIATRSSPWVSIISLDA